MTRSSSADVRGAIHPPRLWRIALRSPETYWKILYCRQPPYFKTYDSMSTVHVFFWAVYASSVTLACFTIEILICLAGKVAVWGVFQWDAVLLMAESPPLLNLSNSKWTLVNCDIISIIRKVIQNQKIYTFSLWSTSIIQCSGMTNQKFCFVPFFKLCSFLAKKESSTIMFGFIYSTRCFSFEGFLIKKSNHTLRF